jgi:hypothetical protein
VLFGYFNIKEIRNLILGCGSVDHHLLKQRDSIQDFGQGNYRIVIINQVQIH